MSKPHPDPFPPQADPVAQLLGRIAYLMDRAFTVPGTGVRFGLDGLLGLLPLGGDLATGLVQVGLVLIAVGRYRVPPAVAAQMMANVLLDIGVGIIPVLGDLFDVAFKANTRNMTLLEPYVQPRGAEPLPRSSPYPSVIDIRPSGASWGCLLAMAVILLGVLLLVLVGFVTLVRWVLHAG
jgi:hypothetical protein